MRLLPCSGSTDCVRFGAMLAPSLRYPKGEPAWAGRYVSSNKCARCKRVTRYAPQDYARLPVLEPEDFDVLADVYKAPQVAELPSQDFVGAGLKRHEARDMYRRGFRHVSEIEAMERPKDEAPQEPETPPAPTGPTRGHPARLRKKKG